MSVENETKDEVNPTPDQTTDQEHLSPEDEAVAEAERALEEAEAAKATDKVEGIDDSETAEFEEVAKATDETPVPDQVDATEPEDPEGKTGDTVPVGVLIEERKQGKTARREAEELKLQNAHLQGQLAAMQAKPDQGAEQPEPSKSPEEQITDLNAQTDEIWAKADEGEVTLLEANQKARELQAQIEGIKQANAPQAPEQVVLDTRIEENLVRLEDEYPVIKKVSPDMMDGFVQQAYQQAEEEGKPIGLGALETMRLHEMTAKAANAHFYGDTPAAQPADPAPKVPAPTDSPSGKQGLSPEAQARSAKLDLAASHPPDINQSGSAAEAGQTDDQLLAKMDGMSEEDRIEFLETMPGLEKRLIGG